MDQPLSVEEKRFLLRVARTTLEDHYAGRAFTSQAPPEGPLTTLRGAFVTLTKKGELRGCIGHVLAVAPLWMSVRQNALAAALGDPRFAPVEASEVADLRLEISALTPLHEVGSVDEIEVGRHGVLVQRGRFRGLLLPQVPIEHGWDRTTFLQHTCRKAGLPPEAWQSPDTKLLAFEAEVFSEEELEC